MKVSLAEAPAAAGVEFGGIAAPARARAQGLGLASVVLAAFSLYWLSALIIAARNEGALFGADTVLYAELAKGQVLEKLGSSYAFDRITRFHPTTTALAVAWMKGLAPLAGWIGVQNLLKALFSAVGAIGVAAALAAFAAVLPRRQAALWTAIYAASLGVWYFSSVEESKIVTATLAAVYIALYLRLRQGWSVRLAAALTAVLLVACLNEIVAAFLAVIPAVDTLVRRGWDLRAGRWIAGHALVAPLAFLVLEAAVKPLTAAAVTQGPTGEGASHLSMLLFYVSQNDFSPATLYAFLVNWLLFNIAAPTIETSLAPAAWPEYMGYFEPALANYLSSPVSMGLIAVLGVMLAAGALARDWRGGGSDATAAVVALAAYAALRGTFYFVVNPSECILYSSGATLAHMLILAIPFAASRLPGKPWVLGACAFLLIVVNGAFIIGP
jgi:hypothetical protein